MTSIKSMTGFAQSRLECDEGTVTLDLKSVNFRYFEATFKLPDQFRSLESALRDKLKKAAPRGKFDCLLTYVPADHQALTLNKELTAALCGHLNYIKSLCPEAVIDAASVLSFEGVLMEDEKVRANLEDKILKLFDELVVKFIDNRSLEGERLKKVMQEKLDAIEVLLSPIKDQLDTLVVQERQKLQEKLEALKAEVSPDRLEQEVALLAQKSDIAEEYDRLQSHISAVRQILDEGGLCGKKLDFMMQEFNREANTMASKAANLDITKAAVELKVLVEQLREQVQNIE